MTLSDSARMAEASEKLEKFLLERIPEWITVDSCEIELEPPNRELLATTYCRSRSGTRCMLTMEVYGLKRSELRHLSDSIKKRILLWYKEKGEYDV